MNMSQTCIAILLPEEDPSASKHCCIVWWWSLCSQKLSTILTNSYPWKCIQHAIAVIAHSFFLGLHSAWPLYMPHG